MEEDCCERTRDNAVHTASWSGKAGLYKNSIWILQCNIDAFHGPKMNEITALATSLAP